MPYGYYQPTPAQIISWLPKDATPEQQDSAVQAHTRPKEIHWSQRPDTLHLPGQPVGRSVLEVNLPVYYKESFFSDKPYWNPDAANKRQGIAGDPVPYTVANDSIMASLLFVCLIGTAMIMSALSDFFKRRMKLFFYPQQPGTSSFTETQNEVWAQLVLTIEASFLLAILFISYLKDRVTDTFTIEQYEMTGLFTGVFASFFILKAVIQGVAGWVFFSSEKNRQWSSSSLFLSATFSLWLLPMVLIQAFFNTDTEISAIYTLSAIGLYELLSFYQVHRIFFLHRDSITGFILYLCTLEVVPLCLIWTTLAEISNFLKINF